MRWIFRRTLQCVLIQIHTQRFSTAIRLGAHWQLVSYLVARMEYTPEDQ